MGAFWPALADALEPSSTVGIEEARQLAFAAAKLERNLVAGVNEYQLECLYVVFQGEPGQYNCC